MPESDKSDAQVIAELREHPDALADYLAKKALSDPKVQRIVRRARTFGELKEDSRWRELYSEVISKEARAAERLANRLLSGEKIDQREVDYLRAFYDGAKWAASHPVQAEKALEHAARDAWLFGLSELEEQDDDVLPEEEDEELDARD
jgi:hypothetical protein